VAADLLCPRIVAHHILPHYIANIFQPQPGIWPFAYTCGKEKNAMFEKQSEEYVKEGAEKVTPKDIETVVDKSEGINKKFSARGPLRRFIEDGKILTALIKDWRAGKYRKALYGTIAAAAFALIYVFNPFDLVPDVLPFIGAVDDAAVVGACLMLVERDLKAYRIWKESQLLADNGKH
jgi:uncharacterized membrane protein YkvA (DUF1232 family)